MHRKNALLLCTNRYGANLTNYLYRRCEQLTEYLPHQAGFQTSTEMLRECFSSTAASFIHLFSVEKENKLISERPLLAFDA